MTEPLETNMPRGEGAGSQQFCEPAPTGSTEWVEALVRQWGPRLLRYLTHAVKDEHAAEDLLQETFLRAYRSAGSYDPSRSLGTWLFTIATRLAISYGRKRRTVTLAQNFDPPDPSQSNPLVAVWQRQEREDLWNWASKVLSDNQFAALWLRYAEDLPVRRIASVMGKTSIHVRVLLSRARHRLIRLAAAETLVAARSGRGAYDHKPQQGLRGLKLER